MIFRKFPFFKDSMRITIIITLLTLVAIVASSPTSDSSATAEHVKEIENLRDLINPESSKKGKKPRKYKCIVIEEGDDDEIIAQRLSQNDENKMNKNKFVFIEADEERRDMVVTATESPAISVAAIPASRNSLRFQQQQYQPQPQQYQQQQPQQQQQSSFLQSPNGFEKISEEEAAVEYPQIQQRQQYQQQVVTLPPPPPQQPPQSFQQQSSSHSRPPLKQIHLPKAHTFAASRNNFPAAQIQTTLPPEIANAPRDAQNRPLILAPEHCDQIKKYANMYGVSDVKAWVHNNCSFAQTYLPTASCEEIDILVASCYRNQLQ
uniref:aECM cysteine-cradle domain-containing protein n=1 Tax=Panagrolaimus davidi TaxID=227884 RepID=A0A914PMV8_9BILA